MSASICFVLRILVPGVALSWPLYREIGAQSRLFRFVLCGALTALIGLTLNILVVMTLGLLGKYDSAWLDLAIVAGVSAAGVIAALLGGRFSLLRKQLVFSAPAAGVVLAAVAVLSMLPAGGNWLVGGWDPGVYMNEGLWLEREGSFRIDDELFLRELNESERPAFSRAFESGVERMPGVFVHPDGQSLTFELFRLTPSAVAFVARCGGESAALKTNSLLGLVALLALAGMLIRHASVAHACFGVAILATQPIFLYHTHVPVSEMLQLCLVVGMGLLLPWRKTSWGLLLLAVLLCSAVLNRFSFLPFGSALVLLVAWADLERTGRWRIMAERCAQVMALAAGALVDLRFAPVSLAGWSVFPTLVGVAAAVVLPAFALTAIAFSRRAREGLAALPQQALWALILAGVAGLTGLYFFGQNHPLPAEGDNVRRLLPYLGPVPFALALAGLLPVYGVRGSSRTFRCFLTFLLGVTALLLVKKHITDIYPWATRRYLPCTVLAIAVLGSGLLAWLWKKRDRFTLAGRTMCLVLLILSVASVSRKSYTALTRTEFEGMPSAIAEAAAQIDDDDVIVADHPWWGTPLMVAHGKQVLNGRQFYRDRSGEAARIGTAALERLARSGRTVRFLTSTESGMDVYPMEIGPVTLDWTGGGTTYQEIVHGGKVDGFYTRNKECIFRIYTWAP